MCSHRSAWLTHNENCRTDGSHDASLKQEIFPAKNILLSCRRVASNAFELLFAKCENMNLLVIDLLLLHKAQIFGNWAKKKWDIHHQNKQHAEPGFVKSNFCVHETDQRRFLQMAADHVSGSRPTRKKKENVREGRKVSSKPAQQLLKGVFTIGEATNLRCSDRQAESSVLPVWTPVKRSG